MSRKRTSGKKNTEKPVIKSNGGKTKLTRNKKTTCSSNHFASNVAKKHVQWIEIHQIQEATSIHRRYTKPAVKFAASKVNDHSPAAADGKKLFWCVEFLVIGWCGTKCL